MYVKMSGRFAGENGEWK